MGNESSRLLNLLTLGRHFYNCLWPTVYNNLPMNKFRLRFINPFVGFSHNLNPFTNYVLRLHKPGQNCFCTYLAFHNDTLFLIKHFTIKTTKFLYE